MAVPGRDHIIPPEGKRIDDPATTSAAPPRIGDLVVCASPRHRAAIGLERDVGLYLVDRRRDAMVYFARPGRSLWLPKRTLRVVAPGDERPLPPPSWAIDVHRVARRIDAVELEIELQDSGAHEVRVGCRELDTRAWADLVALLGARAGGLRARPAGMTRLHVVFAADGAAASGRPPSG